MIGKKKLEELIKEGSRGNENGISVSPSAPSLIENQIGSASLDLRLGRWILVVQQSKSSEINLAGNGSETATQVNSKYYFIPFGGKFVIHPGRFVLGATLEWITLPKNIGGYITGKSSIGRRGLVIETAAGVHPGFSGCLTLEIYNCGEIPIAVTPGMRISQIFFHEIEGRKSESISTFCGHRKPIFGEYVKDIDFSMRQREIENI